MIYPIGIDVVFSASWRYFCHALSILPQCASSSVASLMVVEHHSTGKEGKEEGKRVIKLLTYFDASRRSYCTLYLSLVVGIV